VPNRFRHQLHLKYVLLPYICYYIICMVRPDLCYRKLETEKDHLRRLEIPNKILIQPSRYKDIDLQSYVGVLKKKGKNNYLTDRRRQSNGFLTEVTFQ